jgi:membrane protein DedA with SNARE-associated domain
MMDIEVIIAYISNVAPVYVYIIAFFFAYVENVFPPSPSDLVMVFLGYMVVVSRVHFFPVLIFATLGSTFGYLTMYKLGQAFGDRVVEKGRLKFFSLEGIHKIERWFKKYGYWIVVVNRFLSGTRAVVSFFNVMSHMNFTTTALLSTISSFAWNALLIYAGITLGKRWRYIEDYLEDYTILVTCIISIIILAFVVKKIIDKKRNK